MHTLTIEPHPQAHTITCTEANLIVDLLDGRTISAPLVWFPRLAQASQKQRDNWQLLGEGEGVHWPEIDEDLSVASLLSGTQ
ncbi:MAG: DUF2442 domain-containing protein [Gammaproteobacteria bacterium]|nr:DUF2442 domain-containing protein [Gammaproteobacteria bacterium]